ncbi:carbohydrate kinase [Paenarthrobacter aurescens]|uniref:Ribokinase n=1 Tax=Paenarthrobacter aurescens TaxID=43663 RepID=A0A4Y3NIQ1_PAEAU|nr:carbohydrate kinase [Paenarthrobacter aurescens]MDO6141750.1 carbohydrate kinase [Paenarthrobacter aurescens]MDO6149513.1 carbohydrate kinase [Paenarthrobacter aurescens]MDO6156799.1 carbohydrate kinase [Paenarthrobacter aurescens]MDO6160785.1 carbohydrate kinase [Paenarthrobacter aurescens]GEB18599.1 ribokinase [Paenarthrobacter aurescens]
MLTVIGEALVDVVQRSSGIEAHVGGSPLNVAVGLARLDHPVQFIGRYGKDSYGDSVAAHLRSSSVMVPLPPDGKPTSVATAQIDDDGAATYVFDLLWELPGLAGRLPLMLQGSTLLHTGSIATFLEPGAAEVIAAVEHAHPGSTISFDPNCRPSIITDVEYARTQAERFVVLADVVKASDEDLEWLYPGVDPVESARRWLSLGGDEGPALVVVTRGSRGPWGICRAGETEIPSPSVDVVDTVGAGDSFMAGLLSAIVDHGLDGAQNRSDLRAIPVETLAAIMDHATRAAAVTVSRAGANPPTRAELNHGAA